MTRQFRQLAAMGKARKLWGAFAILGPQDVASLRYWTDSYIERHSRQSKTRRNRTLDKLDRDLFGKTLET